MRWLKIGATMGVLLFGSAFADPNSEIPSDTSTDESKDSDISVIDSSGEPGFLPSALMRSVMLNQYSIESVITRLRQERNIFAVGQDHASVLGHSNVETVSYDQIREAYLRFDPNSDERLRQEFYDLNFKYWNRAWARPMHLDTYRSISIDRRVRE